MQDMQEESSWQGWWSDEWKKILTLGIYEPGAYLTDVGKYTWFWNIDMVLTLNSWT